VTGDEMHDAGARPHIIIAIDGPAASGKSTTAQRVADALAIVHVDSGALYRAATLAALQRGGDPSGWTAASVLNAAAAVTLVRSGHSCVPALRGAVLDEALRSPAVTRHVSHIAQIAAVRGWVNAMVRGVAESGAVVADGRDIGTAVFPHADLKVYLMADPWERARRRLRQRLHRAPTDEETAEETDRLVQRDARDATQSVPAVDAVVIDTTHLSQAEQVDRIVALARAVTRRPDGTLPVDSPSSER
jgi:cytidylate kinase